MLLAYETGVVATLPAIKLIISGAAKESRTPDLNLGKVA